MPLLEFTDRGIYCRQADVYIDAWRPVERVIVTHGHSDHARAGHGYYLCHHLSVPILQARLGNSISVEGKNYRESFVVNGVKFSLHPAGHIIGSAQVRAEYKGELWVFTGDYKVEDDGISTAFEPVRCNAFITECTFGIPAFQWQPQELIFNEINDWWLKNREEGRVSLIAAYSLGKAQRILQGIDPSIGKIYTHGAVENMNEVIRNSGIALHPTTYIHKEIDKKQLKGSLVIAPPSALGTPWQRSLGSTSTAVASGWMGLRGARRRRSVDRGFVLSDHADWKGLNESVKATGAERVIATHGYSNIFTRWLREQGYDARTEATQFEVEGTETADGDQ